MNKRICWIAAAVSAVSLLAGCTCSNRSGQTQTAGSEETEVEVNRLGFDPDTLAAYEGKIRRNEFFSNLLMRLGMRTQDSYLLSEACDSVFDVRKFRSGNRFEAYYSGPQDSSLNSVPDDAVLEYLVYERDAMSDLVVRCRPPFSAWVSEKPVEVTRKYAEVTIRRSLWEDMLDAGVSPLLILNLSDIYAWTVDFFALQKEDSFKVLYDEKTCDGKVIAVDTVRYAVFSHGGEEFPAIMFNQGDGGNIYWNDRGESMRKAFLKAPLQYSRISSGFSYARRHPITRRVQPHTGVDYAAPAGTPVMSIGDGKVTSAKNEGAGGNTIRIRHNSVLLQSLWMKRTCRLSRLLWIRYAAIHRLQTYRVRKAMAEPIMLPATAPARISPKKCIPTKTLLKLTRIAHEKIHAAYPLYLSRLSILKRSREHHAKPKELAACPEKNP